MRPTRLRGARTHNLRGVDLDLEPGELVAVVGPSGSGKSSLAFGTLYAEGQRRYVESFSAYARQFLERLARPPVDELDPIAAAIAVDRQAPVRTSRSTVGTMTDVADYAKGLFAQIAELSCPGCGRPVTRDSAEAVADELLASAADARLVVSYPTPAGVDAEAFVGVREALVEDGYRRVSLDGEVVDLDALAPSQLEGRAELDVVADRLVARAEDRARLVDSLEKSMQRGGGRADVAVQGAGTFRYSSGLHCAHCDRRFRDATPAMFSFNSPVGACATCRGFGRTLGVDWEKVFPDPSRPLKRGAIRPWRGKSRAWERRYLREHAAAAGVPIDVPIGELSDAHRAWLIDGEPGADGPEEWVGLSGWFAWQNQRAYKMHVRVLLARYRSYDRCADCDGARLKPESLAWRVAGRNMAELLALPANAAREFVRGLEERHDDAATALLLRELRARLDVLCDVGLGYLTLDRASRTLSGGEAQRVSLTSSLSASLTGALFVLDEPTVGLHPSDVRRLGKVVRQLRDGDNIVLLVEHDRAMIEACDRVVELGPGAGEAGGAVVFDGTVAELRDADTATGRALRHTSSERRAPRRSPGRIALRGARGNNLEDVDLEFPVGGLTCVTGVSGSGKSTLVIATLVPAVLRALGKGSDSAPLPFDSLEGLERLTSVVHVDQSPLGRTSRGNAATYLKVWDVVRRRFAAEERARDLGFGPGDFSFNSGRGRCETCGGEGAETVEMQFLADVTFSCPDCKGRRFAGPVLEVRHRGLDIADVLELSVAQALERFAGDHRLVERLEPLADVGLGYLLLGQPLNTLSGGEAQRVKLASTLANAPRGSLVVLDEPTAGLHHDDVTPLLAALDRLTKRGDTVLVVEHDMRVAAYADHVVDLGPGAGSEGGRVVVDGPPEVVAAHVASRTAPFLAAELGLVESAPTASHLGEPRPAPSAGLRVEGAREHNLKNVSVTLPREQLVVVTGPSGSGKSSLAFDVVFAEGQRRYLETLSPYARQYMPQLPRPDVDRVTGVPPTVSLEQRMTSGGRNSTVATVTEVSHYLRLLWARVGVPHCPDHGVPISARSVASIVSELKGKRGAIDVYAPVVRGRKGMHKEVFEAALESGVSHALVDGELRELEPRMALRRYDEHDIDLRVARVPAKEPAALHAAIERAARLADGQVRVIRGRTDALYSTSRACPTCGRGFPDLDPRFFSFNTRQGACEGCEGQGVVERTVGRGKKKRVVEEACAECDGTRLSELARAVQVGGLGIERVLGESVSAARAVLESITLEGRDAEIAEAPRTELMRRLAFLESIGVGYLGLSRPARTLSGGETQRVRLAAQLGAGLTGVLYVLDEPTIGLHPRDTGRLLEALRGLVERGNSVLVVEHDDDTIRAADHLVDVGPGGGTRGGRIVAEGPPSVLLADPRSITGAALARPTEVPTERRPTGRAVPALVLEGARMHNLRGGKARFPVGCLTAVTGVSGSGKSTLVRSVLLPAVRAELGLVAEAPGEFEAIAGVKEHFERAVEVDQSPIGRTPRSVPATYINAWNELRKLLAATPEARARGYGASRFSFNTADGRCPECKGNGSIKSEMAFLPDVHLPCDRCEGMRFSDETLEVHLSGMSAGEILALPIEEAAERFQSFPKVARPFALLSELGLGYLTLGQASNTLSGGEAQRLKLVAELGTGASGPTLYVLDEPTTGLHRTDVGRLLKVLGRFVERGDTVVVIEHHPDVIVAADWVIDLGPEAGEGGGGIVAQGTPEKIAAREESHTGAVLRGILGG